MKTIACFISPHGYGHATRTSAILEALSCCTEVEAHIYSTVDEAIFQCSSFPYQFHHQLTDVGFFQKDAFHLDIEKTCSALHKFIPFEHKLVDTLAKDCKDHAFIICDISPLGIAVAARAKTPSILVENFTWDWLYAPYSQGNSLLQYCCKYLRGLYQSADYHIQTEPICLPGNTDLHCNPIFRKVREKPDTIRKRLRCTAPHTVLITMGGIGFQPKFLQTLKQYTDYDFIVAGQAQEARIHNNVLLLSRTANHYHPDLINCADITVFKCGYSTLAECYQVGKPTICISRDGFAESAVIESFISKNMHATIISQEDFISGKWLQLLGGMKTPPKHKIRSIDTNGAEAVAEFLLPLL